MKSMQASGLITAQFLSMSFERRIVMKVAKSKYVVSSILIILPVLLEVVLMQLSLL